MREMILKELSFYYEPGTFIAAFSKFPYMMFLDSSLENTHGRYSIIGLYPQMILEETAGICRINGAVQAASIECCLQKLLQENQTANTSVSPFSAGLLGYFSYDYGKKFEKTPQRHKSTLHMPDALFIQYHCYIVADLRLKKLYLSSDEEAFLPEIEARIQCGAQEANVQPIKHAHLATFTADFTKEEYKAAIEQMISYIIEGDLYIGNMTQQLTVHSQKDPFETFQYLRTFHPTPFGAYFNHPDFQIVCGSMERFLQVENQNVTTVPIKGTRKRGNTPKEDALLRLNLEQSEKERSELLMIVDLERNDFSRICKPNTIQVKRPFQVDTYATVFHLSSVVEGELMNDKTCADLMTNVFPGGSITGAPKIRAMEIIDELEHHRRGLYTGSIGYFSFDGNCDFNIVIRTGIYQNGCYHLGVGGGITCESELEFEYEETLQKAKAFLEAAWEGDHHA